MRVFVTGASGFLGRSITRALLGRGDQVLALGRSGEAERGAEALTGDPTQVGPWRERLRGCDAVLHFAGEPIAGKRWNAEQKDLLRSSRVESGAQIVQAIAALPAGSRPRVLVTASGVDIYPFDKTSRAYAEDAAPGRTFVAELCRAWEAATAGATERTVALRLGVVLGKGEGALAKLMTPFRLFVGGPIGSGEQWTSWVHVDDVVGAALHALDRDEVRGPQNVVASSVRQRDFAQAVGDALKRPTWLPVPGLALRVAVGELADYLVHGRRAVPSALEKSGYVFKRPVLGAAIEASV
jgi:uncharacterized protein (TIGR01777 family)